MTAGMSAADVQRLAALIDEAPTMGGSAGLAVRLLDAGLRFDDGRATCEYVRHDDSPLGGTASCSLADSQVQRLEAELVAARRELAARPSEP